MKLSNHELKVYCLGISLLTLGFKTVKLKFENRKLKKELDQEHKNIEEAHKKELSMKILDTKIRKHKDKIKEEEQIEEETKKHRKEACEQQKRLKKAIKDLENRDFENKKRKEGENSVLKDKKEDIDWIILPPPV